MNPYKVLGVAHTATDDEVKKAYRRLSRQYHPDSNPENPKVAEEKFKQVQDAYQTIIKMRKEGYTGNPETYGQTYEGYNPYTTYQRRYNQQTTYQDYGSGQQRYYQTHYFFTAKVSENDPIELKSAADLINRREFQMALQILAKCSTKSARYYYLSALANLGIGNNVVALQHINQASFMDPNNPDYQDVKRYLQLQKQRYEQTHQTYTSGSLPRYCFRLVLCNILFDIVCGIGRLCCRY